MIFLYSIFSIRFSQEEQIQDFLHLLRIRSLILVMDDNYERCVNLMEIDREDVHDRRLQTTQPTSGGAVTADSSGCANCVEPPRPQQWGPDLPFFGHVGHAEPLDGWRCCSQKRVMSRPIQVRQL